MNKEMIEESEIFNQMADYYGKYRPDYPDEVITAIIEKANLSAGSKLLEIGSEVGKQQNSLLIMDAIYFVLIQVRIY